MKSGQLPSEKQAEFQLLSLFLKKAKGENLLLSDEIRGYKIAINILTEQLSKKDEILRTHYHSTVKKQIIELVDEILNRSPITSENLDELKAGLEHLFSDEQNSASLNTRKNLSMSEKRIAELLKSGARAKDIAENLGISPYTAQTHIKNIRKKLCITGRNVPTGRHLSEISN